MERFLLTLHNLFVSSRDLMQFAVRKVSDPNDALAVFFPGEERVGVKDIRKCVGLNRVSRLSFALLTNEPSRLVSF